VNQVGQIATKLFQGSTQIWVITIALAVFSFLPIYSASSITSHAMHVILGFGILFVTHRVPYRYYGPLSTIFVWLSIGLLVMALLTGRTIGGANASRWIYILGFSFQPSAFAQVALLMFLSRRLAKFEGVWTMRYAFRRILWPIFLICALVLPANFSTTALIFLNAIILLTIGGFPLKHTGKIVGAGALCFTLFLLVAPMVMESTRIDTWRGRIESFFVGGDEDSNYQQTLAQTAIAQGGITGQGPGGGLHKHFLPQNNSDFVYALIVEEYGLIGGSVILMMYIWLLLAALRVANRAKDRFGKLMAFSLAFSIVLQAMVNMAVAVGLFPVTGQTLPLISAGGTSIWMTCLAIGAILAVSRGHGDGELADADIEDAMASDLEKLTGITRVEHA